MYKTAFKYDNIVYNWVTTIIMIRVVHVVLVLYLPWICSFYKLD